MIEARMELSLRHFEEAKAKSLRAVDLAASEKHADIVVQAKCALGLAETRSGAARAGTILCNEAVEMAAKTGDPLLLSSALLAQAEAMMENNQSQPALETALRAQESFARFGQMDSEWRAWLVAARAAQRMGDKTKSREYAGQSEARLSSLGQKWSSEAYNGYLARPDVKNFRSQLNQALNPQR
jgi:hypothetical protein